jgi:hypothetical protein
LTIRLTSLPSSTAAPVRTPCGPSNPASSLLTRCRSCKQLSVQLRQLVDAQQHALRERLEVLPPPSRTCDSTRSRSPSRARGVKA